MSDYRGMSYEQASREADRLIAHGGWYRNFEKLKELREIMELSRREKRLVWTDGDNTLWLQGQITDSLRDFLVSKPPAI